MGEALEFGRVADAVFVGVAPDLQAGEFSAGELAVFIDIQGLQGGDGKAGFVGAEQHRSLGGDGGRTVQRGALDFVEGADGVVERGIDATEAGVDVGHAAGGDQGVGNRAAEIEVGPLPMSALL